MHTLRNSGHARYGETIGSGGRRRVGDVLPGISSHNIRLNPPADDFNVLVIGRRLGQSLELHDTSSR